MYPPNACGPILIFTLYLAFLKISSFEYTLMGQPECLDTSQYSASFQFMVSDISFNIHFCICLGLSCHPNILTSCSPSNILYLLIFIKLSAGAVRLYAIFFILWLSINDISITKHYLHLYQYSLVCPCKALYPILIFIPHLAHPIISTIEYLLSNLLEWSDSIQYSESFQLSIIYISINIHWCVHARLYIPS